MDPSAAVDYSRPRARTSGAFRRVVSWSRPIVAGLLGTLGGVVAAQFYLPKRMTTVEAQIASLKVADSVQTTALMVIHTDLRGVSVKLDASQRLQCIDAREKALKGDRSPQLQLDAAEIPCGELLGNRIRQ
jgi:hypothetical protein